MKPIPHLISAGILVSVFGLLPSAFSQGSAFTYQGRLNDNGSPANGSYDLRFVLYTADPGGTQVGPILTNPATPLSGGLFTVKLDFGANIFAGADRFLEIAARTNGGGGFAVLNPRQALTPSPYAVFAEKLGNGGLSAGTYTNAVLFNNAANSFYGDGLGLVNLSASQLSVGTVPDARLASNIARLNQVWQIGGNAGTSNDFIGTTDDQPFDVRVNNTRVMRYRLATDAGGVYTNAPNVIGGSSVNVLVSGVVGATIAGGGGNIPGGAALLNKVAANFGTVGGGDANLSSGLTATVAGGDGNTASGPIATVGGGGANTASGNYATVAGGYFNTASGYTAAVAGGYTNTASGYFATVPGGNDNVARGWYSLAAGYHAKADDDGSFVWADSSDFDFHSTTPNQFRVRATGGAAFATAINGSGGVTAGVHLLSGDTAWSSISDRNAKKNFQPVNGERVLEKLVAMPVESWNYKWESDTNTPHLGPMAQDFKAAFYPGRDDKSISTLEFDGVELAAIQGLNQKVEQQKSALKQKDAELQEVKQRLETLEKTILNQKSN
jgi:hypothetical protein